MTDKFDVHEWKLNQLINENQVEENAFVLAADAARDAGEEEFEFPKGSGKMHKVTIKADIKEDDWKLDPNDEVSMVISQLKTVLENATTLLQMTKDGQQYDAWVQAKITKAADYLESVRNYQVGE
jgi:hypothetical protein